MFHKKTITFLLGFLLCFQTAAQTVPTAESGKPEVSPEVREKAVNLLNTLSREAEQFSLPFNRVSARTAVAGLLWNTDEKSARAIFQNAVADLNFMIGQIPPDVEGADDEYIMERYKILGDVKTLRSELLLTLAARDPKYALDSFQFLTVRNADGKSIFEEDQAFELDLAAKITANDPKQAYELAKKNLDNGLGANLFTTLESLYGKDAELGAKLAQDILSKIKSSSAGSSIPGSTNTGSNSNTAVKPAVTGSEPAINSWEIQSFFDTVQKLNRKAVKDKKPAVLSENDVKETVGTLAQFYLKQDYLSSYEVAKIMPEITKYFPTTATAIRRKIGQQESATLNNLVKTQTFQNETEGKTADEIIQIIERKPVAERDDLYYQSAEKAFSEGEIEQAKKFHSKVKTAREYDYLDKSIDDAMPSVLAEKGDLNEVRQALAKLKTPEEKIEVLATLAKTIARGGDKKTAAALVGEARSIYSGKMKNRRNLNSVLSMAQAFAVIEPEQGFGIIESNVSYFNELINAGIMLDEFNEYGSIENDELRLDTVRSESYRNLPKGVGLIKSLSAADFERTVNLTDRFARPEARFYGRFRIAEAILDPSAEQNEKEFIKNLQSQEYEH